jgi:lipopolysaccharide cholinephosphotransferase
MTTVQVAVPDISQLYPDCRDEGGTTLRQCQLVMIRMLKILDHICASERISYWMTAGTLIGALRHRGMIPWDGDIDVAMTEADYQAFCGVANQLPADMFFQTPQTDSSFRSEIMAKLRDRYSCYTEWQSKNPNCRWHNGLQVDIFFYRENALGQLVNPFRGTAYDRCEIFPLQRIEFEGTYLLAPRDPDRYIRRRYGDYLRLPPPEERIPHEGVADPFTPCDHRESRIYPHPRTQRQEHQSGSTPLARDDSPNDLGRTHARSIGEPMHDT